MKYCLIVLLGQQKKGKMVGRPAGSTDWQNAPSGGGTDVQREGAANKHQ
jgi:hypothetical protein